MSTDLDKIFEGKEDERWKLIKDFMNIKDIEGKTDLKDSDIEYLTKIELLEKVINKHFFNDDKENEIGYLKEYCTFFRINRISLKRKSREELVKMVQSITGSESEITASLKKKMLGI